MKQKIKMVIFFGFIVGVLILSTINTSATTYTVEIEVYRLKINTNSYYNEAGDEDYILKAVPYTGSFVESDAHWEKDGTGTWYYYTYENGVNPGTLSGDLHLTLYNVEDRSSTDDYCIKIEENDLLFDDTIFSTTCFEITSTGPYYKYLYYTYGGVTNEAKMLITIS
ncbi:MAG: hypothetical protein INQ03_25600 [Candidatus Heimdallarchaeota archaeon]|nr:hypothetical protein [Candidatus Heimdallarchaeota archaeon]